MPRNRVELDREAKVEEILVAAERILRTGGFESLSLNALAQELGLRRGAIHWYFRTKDDLFVAAARRMFAAALAKGPRRSDYVRRIHWAIDQLSGLDFLYRALHERARHASAAAELERQLEANLCERLRELLRPHVPADRVEDVAQTIVVFGDGLFARPSSAAERRRRLGFLLRQLLPGD